MSLQKWLKGVSRNPGESGLPPATHTSIRGGSYIIPLDKQAEFFVEYKRARTNGENLYLTEKPMNPSPMRTDLDFRFSMPTEGLVRSYKKEDIVRIVSIYFETLEKYIDAPPEHFVAYVMEKKAPVTYRGNMKDGLHIVWPHLVIPHNLQHLIRQRILDRSAEMFASMHVINKHEDVVDKAIIDVNAWQMYGSKKPDNEPYLVTQIYKWQDAGVVEMPQPSPEEELGFVQLFSMRHREAERSQIRPECISEIEEYTRLILPQIEGPRKNKLDQQIFDKHRNLMRKYTNDDELNLAKQLVERCINHRRAESYEDWIKLGWTLRNIDERLLETWINFSKISSKYVEGECEAKWHRMRNDTLGMGTLRWWAREDNPQEYNKLMNENVMVLVDKCIGSEGAHFDVAKVVYAMYKDRYRFIGKSTWYTYEEKEHRWKSALEGGQLRIVLSTEVCTKFIERSLHYSNEAARMLEGREIAEAKSVKLSKISRNLKTSGYKEGVMKECRALFTDEKFEELLDSHPHLIGFENGVYDLRMGEFRDGLPDDYIRFSTRRNYVHPKDLDPEEVKQVEAYLSQVFTNKQVCHYMMDLLACSVDGGIRQEKFYVFTGSGSNSKSALLNLVQKSFGDYYCILPIALLTQKRVASNSAQSELERTRGRRFAIMQEPGEQEKLNIGLMKELSGGDLIQCRGLFKEPIEFKPQFKMIMTCNELPEVPSDDGGTWRRIRVIEFTSKFVPTPDPNNPREFPLDPELMSKFEQWANIFPTLVLEHHRKMNVKDIHEPTEVRIATEGYKKNNDLIGQFISEKIVQDDTSTMRIMLNNVFTDFKTWAAQTVQRGKKLPDRNQLRAYMEKTFGPYPADSRGWRGLRYVVDEQASDDDN